MRYFIFAFLVFFPLLKAFPGDENQEKFSELLAALKAGKVELAQDAVKSMQVEDGQVTYFLRSKYISGNKYKTGFPKEVLLEYLGRLKEAHESRKSKCEPTQEESAEAASASISCYHRISKEEVGGDFLKEPKFNRRAYASDRNPCHLNYMEPFCSPLGEMHFSGDDEDEPLVGIQGLIGFWERGRIEELKKKEASLALQAENAKWKDPGHLSLVLCRMSSCLKKGESIKKEARKNKGTVNVRDSGLVIFMERSDYFKDQIPKLKAQYFAAKKQKWSEKSCAPVKHYSENSMGHLIYCELEN